MNPILDLNMKPFIFIRGCCRRPETGQVAAPVAAEQIQFCSSVIRQSVTDAFHRLSGPSGAAGETQEYVFIFVEKVLGSEAAPGRRPRTSDPLRVSTGVDVRRPDGGHPLLQGGSHLQEVRPLQGPRWGEPGPGESLTALQTHATIASKLTFFIGSESVSLRGLGAVCRTSVAVCLKINSHTVFVVFQMKENVLYCT